MIEDTSNYKAPRELQVPQDRETGIQKIAAGPFRLRYLYARSSDCRQSDDPGQDYVALRQDGRRLAFALCDGVSQSFYGDLAARFLGDALVQWLWHHLPPGEFRREYIQQPLHQYLLALTDEATREVRQALIPEDAPLLLRDALEQKRAIGSEATFVCGVVEMPGPNLPGGRVMLAWLGDAELQLWGQERDRTRELGAEWVEARRWSTKVGPKGGLVGVFVGPLEDVQRVLAYSDGIGSLRERLGHGIGDSELAREVERLGEMPTSDDVSFLEIEVLPEPAVAPIPVTVPAPVVPPPKSPPVPPRPEPAPPVGAPPPPLPPARPWLVYAGAGVALITLCLLGALGGRWLLGRKAVSSPTATSGPTALPSIATKPPTGPVPTSPLSTPLPQPTSPLPIPSPPITTPTQVPDAEGRYQLPKRPLPIAPLEGQEMLLEGAMVVVGGQDPDCREDRICTLRVAREGGDDAVLHFRRPLTHDVSLDAVRWVWTVYPAQLHSSGEPVDPLLIVLELESGELETWSEGKLQEGQDTWVYGVNSQAGLCHSLAQDCPIEELGVPILVKGSWRQPEGDWEFQMTEWYRFDPDKRAYVLVE